MDKVYCKNCKYYCKGSNLGFYDVLKVAGSIKHIDCNTDLCTVNKKTVVKHIATPIKSYRLKEIIVDNPRVLNKDNNCKYYKKQKFLFWISGHQF